MIGVFYLQSFYSIMESIPSLESLVKKAKENQYQFLALSDHENLHGMVNFVELCQKNKIKPILGIKVFLSLKEIINKDKIINFLIYASNDIGINNLIKISNLIKTKQENITLKVLKKFQEGLFFIVSNVDFELSNINDWILIEKIFTQLKNNLNFFFFGLSLQSKRLEIFADIFLSLMKKLKIFVVPAHKTNFLEIEQEEGHKLLFELNNPLKYSQISSEEKMSFQFLNLREIQNKYNYYYNDNDYRECFLDLNSFMDKIQYNKLFPSDIGIPIWKESSEKNSFTYLEEITNVFLRKKISVFSARFPLYLERLKKELKIIKDMHYEDYFLIVFDIVRYTREKKILLGSGRGSSPGSLVCFCLDITEADPLYYNLLFERFLNPKRNKKPDIDLDFPDDKINIILKYIYEKYGEHYTSNIITFNTLTIKSFIRNTNYVNYLKKNLKFNDPDSKQIKILSQLEGIPQFTGTHSAGVIISNKNLLENIPIQKNPHINSPFKYQTQLDANYLEKIGLFKIDLLSLKSLSLIDKIIKEINKNREEKISWEQLPLNDLQTYQLLQKGDTEYIFQLESPAAKQVLRKIKPQNFEDLNAVLALNRPGQINYINNYCRNKHEEKNFLIEKSVYNYIEHTLKNTYGIILYQEQIMEISVYFAGYDFGEAEIFMKYIIQKVISDNDKNSIKSEFVKRSKQKGHSEQLANQIYDYILKFSNYSFNKSHSVSYSLISYRMAYLKTHFLVPFLTVILNEHQNIPFDKEMLLKKIKNTNEIKIIAPNIFISDIDYKLSKEKLLLPLTLIRNVNNEIASFLINERMKKKFVNFFDFKNRCQKVLNNDLLKDLVLSGIFDDFGLNKNTLLNEANLDYLEHEQYLLSFKKEIILDELPEEYLRKEIYRIFGFDLNVILN
ncbi:DNA polymerase III alpha subunit [Candidatus Phytoplasma rubi]|uniref:DNA-directed DNA polymerase n=1 Tax=Candidatus Phytoplasma rubi TaxID=399025 RepID=A0ABY7BRX9_9MOLU|nr:PHP domain-containing protein [Candidatus Phytoplasma rubi]WAN63414.1 DNA polymerase III alpha subunit [Candidatus Phytoplasma rubi]